MKTTFSSSDADAASISFFLVVLLCSVTLTLAAPQTPQETIVGGANSPAGAYPWMAALVARERGTIFDDQFCGGALIAPGWILTAAHCVKRESVDSFEVWIGLHNLDKPGGAVRRRVSQIILHPFYSADSEGNLFYDLALIRLNGPVSGIAPIALASEASHSAAGSTARVLGWGALSGSNHSRYPNILQQADLQIVDLEEQQSNYENRLGASHLAAAAPPSYSSDACAGDSGGPLFRTIDNLPILVGITSFGDGCAEPGVAGIYANVFDMRTWITAVMSDPNGPLIVSLNKRISRLMKKAKAAKKRGQLTKARRLNKKVKRLKRRRNAL